MKEKSIKLENNAVKDAFAKKRSCVANNLPESVQNDGVYKGFPQIITRNDSFALDYGDVADKYILKVNSRTKVPLISPKKHKELKNSDKSISQFRRKQNRYASVDSSMNRAKINKTETSISKFANVQANKYQRQWFVNERPDEKLKRHLKMQRHKVAHDKQIQISDQINQIQSNINKKPIL